MFLIVKFRALYRLISAHKEPEIPALKCWIREHLFFKHDRSVLHFRNKNSVIFRVQNFYFCTEISLFNCYAVLTKNEVQLFSPSKIVLINHS